ncbi:MAG: SOS response-associated peptidase [Myxococcales bacterium]|nr:SOS response-associated peptidase [Myxococcales bacterium]
MCGRYTLTAPGQLVFDEFDLHGEVPRIEPRYNVAPSQLVVVVGARPGAPGPTVARMRWGFSLSGGKRVINARRETLAERPLFRRAFAERRCLVVADGFYEWKPEGGAKQPYYVRLGDRPLFAFAGLWRRAPSDDAPSEAGEAPVVHECVIITAPSSGGVRDLHDRMPVVVPRARYAEWLDPSERDLRRLARMLDETPADAFELRPVSTLVNSPRNDGPECVAAVAAS